MTAFATESTKSMSNSRSTETKPEHGTLKEHASHIREDVATLKSDATAAASALGTVVHDEAARAAELAKTGGEKAKDAHAAICTQVSKHPTAAVLTTLGIGILVGRFLGGR